MRKRIEVAGYVCVNNFTMASIDQLVDVFDRVQCTAACSIGVLLGLQVGLENRFENQHCRHLRDSILDHGDGQRELHLSTASIWDGPRSVTHSIRCAVNASQYSKSDASLGMTLSFFVDWIVALSASRWSG